jgi:hypothetical protein
LAGLAAGCGDSGTNIVCGTGTVLDTDGKTCISTGEGDLGPGLACGPNTVAMAGKCVGMDVAAALAKACPGPNYSLDMMTGLCSLTASACANGTELNGTKDGCIKATVKGSLIFSNTSDQVWSTLRYHSGTSVITVGNNFAVTAPGIQDTDVLYLQGLGANNALFDATIAPMFAFGARPPVPVQWDANAAKPSNTPFAIDHQITVGEWKACTLKWAVYINPPRKITTQHWYKFTVDASGCPADLMFGMWWNYSNNKDITGRNLGTPAGGIPNNIATIQDGTFHFERDFDPAVWTASAVSLNGNTHTGGPGATPTTTTGKVPDLSTNPDASFFLTAFVHNDGQSNGNGGWCMGDPADATKCGITNNISNWTAATNAGLIVNQPGNLHTATPNDITPLASPYVRPYIFLPGKVGFDSVAAFSSGVNPAAPQNTMPLKALQPY